jgi:hypothetical protein
MHEDPHAASQEPVAGRDQREDWVAPLLTEIGPFEELTQNGFNPSSDAEATS